MPRPCFPALAAAAIALAVQPPAVSAQEPAGVPDGFEAAMTEALTGAGEEDGLLRCTGLFRAFRLYAGAETEVGAIAAERETDMAVLSAIIWQSRTGLDDNAAAFAAIVPMVEAATEIWLDRMVANQDASGSVFDDDLEDQLGFCNVVRNRLMEAGDG